MTVISGRFWPSCVLFALVWAWSKGIWGLSCQSFLPRTPPCEHIFFTLSLSHLFILYATRMILWCGSKMAPMVSCVCKMVEHVASIADLLLGSMSWKSIFLSSAPPFSLCCLATMICMAFLGASSFLCLILPTMHWNLRNRAEANLSSFRLWVLAIVS